MAIINGRSIIFAVVVVFQIVHACWFNNKPQTRCCAEIGNNVCFGKDIGFTFPACPNTFTHQFILYIRSNNQTGIPFTKDAIPSEFSNDRPTIFIVHGWMDIFSSMLRLMKDKLLVAKDYNVISVDWRGGANDYNYIQSAASTISMGSLVGAMVNNMRQSSGSNPNYWCIGHSLGAHVCAFTARTASPILDRITGLDPAAPLFYADGLTSQSATKVDIIHTDPILGLAQPRGTVDFYPNSGRNQPGCTQARSAGNDYEKYSETDIIKLMQRWFTGRSSTLCSHLRSMEYMVTSIENPTCYPADESCSNYRDLPGSCQNITDSSQFGMMGYDATSHRYSGLLHMTLNTTAPFCTES